MFEIGEYVIYGNNGVCKIEEISLMTLPGINESKNYYTLKPVYENSKIFAPVDTKVYMRDLVTSDEIDALIQTIPSIEDVEFDNKNVRGQQEYYKKLLDTHSCIDLLTIIKNIGNKKEKAAENGKRLGQVEEKYLKIAKDLVDEEFSLVLGISKNEVESYINDVINR